MADISPSDLDRTWPSDDVDAKHTQFLSVLCIVTGSCTLTVVRWKTELNPSLVPVEDFIVPFNTIVCQTQRSLLCKFYI